LTLGACSDFTGVEDSGSTGADASGSTSSTPSGGGEGSSAPGSTTSDDDTTTGGVTTDADPSSPETTDPTNDPTDADTETSGKDPTTGDSSTGEPPPSDCGDGVEQPGEACDDGNQDELDGCTSACVIGPLALDFGPQTQTAKEGGGSNTQIQTFVDTCPDPQVLVGLSGGLSSEGWIGVIRGECQDGRIDNADPTTFRTTGPINQLPPRGQFDQDGPWGTQCPPNQAIIAVRGGAGDVMDGLEVECAEVATVGSPGAYSLETSSTGWQPLQGGAGGGDFGPLRCPEGSVATGVDTDTNSYVIRIRLLCRPVDLQYP
jgi:cysteine-rich repeat protein